MGLLYYFFRVLNIRRFILRLQRIVGHVHDEIILEAEKDASVQDICEQMGRTPAWIPGLILRADGYECEYYRKD